MIEREVRGFFPQCGQGCFIAENAVLVGDIIMGSQCSVWYGAVLRGDVNSIRIGNRVNIQDGCILHTTYRTTTIRIGDDVSIGHGAIVHGAEIESEVLIGMGAIVMDHVTIGKHAIIAAGAVVPEHTVIPERSVFAGIPARQTGTVSENQVNDLILKTAKNYLMYAGWYLGKDGK